MPRVLILRMIKLRMMNHRAYFQKKLRREADMLKFWQRGVLITLLSVMLPGWTKDMSPTMKQIVGLVPLPEDAKEIGTWKKTSGSAQGCDVAFLYSASANKYFRTLSCGDSKNRDAEELARFTIAGQAAFRNPDAHSRFGDYYVLRTNGVLAVFDKDGFIAEYPVLRQPAALAATPRNDSEVLDTQGLLAFLDANYDSSVGKSQYETKAEHAARLAPLRRTFAITVKPRYAQLSFNYDADSETLDVHHEPDESFWESIVLVHIASGSNNKLPGFVVEDTPAQRGRSAQHRGILAVNVQMNESRTILLRARIKVSRADARALVENAAFRYSGEISPVDTGNVLSSRLPILLSDDYTGKAYLPVTLRQIEMVDSRTGKSLASVTIKSRPSRKH